MVDVGKFTTLQSIIRSNAQLSMQVCAVKTLTEFIRASTASTSSEEHQNLQRACEALKASSHNSISLSGGCDLFLREVTRMPQDDIMDFKQWKQQIILRGEAFVLNSGARRESIASLGLQILRPDLHSTVLIHSHSRVVVHLLQRAAADVQPRRLLVYVTESRPTSNGKKAVEILREAGIEARVILDTAVARVMSKIDMVLVGAEGICANGGLLNQLGTYQIALVAKQANVPFYVVAESSKFMKSFPLNQPEVGMEKIMVDEYDSYDPTSIEFRSPPIDYTPPEYITSLLTDLGIISTSRVSEEIVNEHM
ncbi:S-methyl-5-thioribose-1-phosphate isomerase [Synchytrium microbalum]|uniref:Translation initiation factor eIF2B subunit alpha n=1 Tax=Synchytrium microbalum TaxID=1806994 RepID=A0A507C5R2_9FUNG|nr:S-methyl-5-thioribose-1-phosphate isomerase [Synchytrium microbalum]TPX32805.1 S-methyl-5-thioribose-1-phosphate isomerase [Synchytrium microbalum]